MQLYQVILAVANDSIKEDSFIQRFTTKSILIFLILFLSGSIITIYSSSELIEAYERYKWETAVATVLESSVVETGSIRPMVKYSYEVGDKTFSGSSGLHSPGFGNKAKQYDVAMKLSRKYPIGKQITIYYNPLNNSESIIIKTPHWDTFTRISAGVVLLMLSLIYLFYSIRRRKTISVGSV